MTGKTSGKGAPGKGAPGKGAPGKGAPGKGAPGKGVLGGALRKAPQRREKKVEATRRKLFDAALKVVGESGYSGCSIARIAAHANVAQGTFYSYFASQQDVFDQLLPYLGDRLLNELREKLRGCTDPYEREAIGFRAYFDFLSENPEFERILSEADVFTPQGFHDHVRNIVGGYMRAFRKSLAHGELPHYSERELEAVTYMLLGARVYLSRRFMAGDAGGVGGRQLPEWVVTAYMKLLRYGLTGPRRIRPPGPGIGPSESADNPAQPEPELVSRAEGCATVCAEFDPDRTRLLPLLADLAAQAAEAAMPRQEGGCGQSGCGQSGFGQSGFGQGDFGRNDVGLGSFTYVLKSAPAGGRLYALAEVVRDQAGLASASIQFREGRADGPAIGSAMLTGTAARAGTAPETPSLRTDPPDPQARRRNRS